MTEPPGPHSTSAHQAALRLVQAILAAGSAIAGTVILGAAHIGSSERIRGITFGTPGGQSTAYWEASSLFFSLGTVLLVIAVGFTIAAMWPRRAPGE